MKSRREVVERLLVYRGLRRSDVVERALIHQSIRIRDQDEGLAGPFANQSVRRLKDTGQVLTITGENSRRYIRNDSAVEEPVVDVVEETETSGRVREDVRDIALSVGGGQELFDAHPDEPGDQVRRVFGRGDEKYALAQ